MMAKGCLFTSKPAPDVFAPHEVDRQAAGSTQSPRGGARDSGDIPKAALASISWLGFQARFFTSTENLYFARSFPERLQHAQVGRSRSADTARTGRASSENVPHAISSGSYMKEEKRDCMARPAGM